MEVFAAAGPFALPPTKAVPFQRRSSAHLPSGPRSRRPSRLYLVSDLRYPCSDTSASTAGHRPPSQRAAHRQTGRPAAGMGARLDTVGLSGQSRRRPAAQPVARPHCRVGTAWPAGAGLDWPGHGARGGVTLLRAGRRSARFFSAQLGFPTHLSIVWSCGLAPAYPSVCHAVCLAGDEHLHAELKAEAEAAQIKAKQAIWSLPAKNSPLQRRRKN